MSKQHIIEQTVQLLEQLPEEQAAEILDFAAFLAQRKKQPLPVVAASHRETVLPLESQPPKLAQDAGAATIEEEDVALAQQMAVYVETSPVFAFLHDPAEDIYTLDDLKVRYQ